MKYAVWVTRTTDELWIVEADSREEAIEDAMFADGVLVSAEQTRSRLKKCQRRKDEEDAE